jgi:predicted dehydrogenase
MTFAHAITSGRVGTPRLATILGHSALAAPLDMKAPSWWFDAERGGGWLGAAVSHRVDAIRCWLGEFENVSAVLPMVSGRDPTTHAEDSVSARFRMRSGCEGVLQESAGVWGDGLSVTMVAGPDGTLAIDGTDVTLATADGTVMIDPIGPPPALEVEPSDDPRHRFTHLELAPAVMQARVLRDMVLGVELPADLPPPATFADGVACMEVLDAMRKSAASDGSAVAVRG